MPPRKPVRRPWLPKPEGPIAFDRPWHHHRCERCGRRFTDANASVCPGRDRDGVCGDCVGAGRPEWDRWHDPADCCPSNAVAASRQVRSDLLLAGPPSMTWFVCGVCWRQIPFNPASFAKPEKSV